MALRRALPVAAAVLVPHAHCADTLTFEERMAQLAAWAGMGIAIGSAFAVLILRLRKRGEPRAPYVDKALTLLNASPLVGARLGRPVRAIGEFSPVASDDVAAQGTLEVEGGGGARAVVSLFARAQSPRDPWYLVRVQLETQPPVLLVEDGKPVRHALTEDARERRLAGATDRHGKWVDFLESTQGPSRRE